MLYDPKWEAPAKADPLSLDSLIAWLEKQPAGRMYEYTDEQECALGQWLKSIDPERRPGSPGTGCYVYIVNSNVVDLEKFDAIAIGHPRTLGAALNRAREMRSSVS